MITTFFTQLSEYYYKENDLSNVTCSMCKAVPSFMDKFVRFFFPNLETSKIISMEREVCDEEEKRSRVDFLIRLEDYDEPYLIEVKIYDENHHFGQYEADYHVTKDRLGYITNYYCTEGIDRGYDVKTWQEWYNILESALHEFSEEERSICIGYLSYLKKVCGFCNLITSLDFDETAEKDFIKQLRQIINGNGLTYRSRVTGPMKEAGKHNVLFYWFYPAEDKPCACWVGTLSLSGKTFICVGISKVVKNSTAIYNALKLHGLPENEWFGELLSIKYFSSPSLIIPMSESKHQAFVSCHSPMVQTTILAGFLNELQEFLATLL